ncbi:MAG: acylphosphatase [Armatimonadota bacterium]|nr:acylphosphatase [Armatimonadota bacterium]MDR7423099.1 acylphosphatase [Armatimonadota bacterium]MDR7454802.1 acylphosphatase [Armatimonadota bacterium]MDR7457507.1 acylphosphatase [Armatimonadota bacterium]MDR7498037.1 acylphosphatase [Armatimonadota bacterium]
MPQPSDPRPADEAASARPGAVRALLRVRGQVQGVGFRVFVHARAGALGLTGFVRNLRDGRVEAAVEGPRAAVEALIEAVRRGPAGARVAGVDVRWEPPRGEVGFRIRVDGDA